MWICWWDQQGTDKPERKWDKTSNNKDKTVATNRHLPDTLLSCLICMSGYLLFMSQTEGLDVVWTLAVAHSDLLIAVGCEDVPVVQRHGLKDSREEKALSRISLWRRHPEKMVQFNSTAAQTTTKVIMTSVNQQLSERLNTDYWLRTHDTSLVLVVCVCVYGMGWGQYRYCIWKTSVQYVSLFLSIPYSWECGVPY